MGFAGHNSSAAAFPCPLQLLHHPSVHILSFPPSLILGASLICFFHTAPARTHPSSLPRPVSYFLLSLLAFLLSFFQTLMALVLLRVTFPNVSTVHYPCPMSQQTGHGEQDTCSTRPPAFFPPLCHHQGSPSCPATAPRASAELNQRTDLAQNQPTPLLQICSAPQSSQLVQNWPRVRPAQGKPKSILFRQTDLPSVMKLPQSHICNYQQCWHC